MTGPLTPRARRVFLDSSGFLALINPRDTYHAQARAAWTKLTEEGWHTFTTNFVVAETHALFLTRLGHDRATAFLRHILQSSTTIVRVSLRDEQQAQLIVFRYDDKNFSYTDASSFAVMERLRIGPAFTFDHNFEQYGREMVGPNGGHR
jgi:uncharacterized protein